MAQVILMGLDEKFFWNETPKKIIALIEQKNEIDRVKQKNLAIYIASYVWGKDPDELEQTDRKKKPIPGIDVPAGDVSALFG